ncbi:MAG TPA: SRPBCC domain-containing protein [Kofleriaceae bacterium]|nr:SRPBCC domain-containing protein [Kofleriaceae bacterium]
MQETPSGRATVVATAFRTETAVAINIRAPAARVWSLLTNAADLPRWNSTVDSLEGTIAVGQRLALRVPIAPRRTFKPKVTALEPETRMVWSDGAAPMFKGVRTFTLTPRGDGSTDFSMVEVLSGLMLPMVRRSLPDFGPPFERYAADLKVEAERASP